ncbi:MAG: hypothetical protein JWR54_657 [Mucilaginibacter sp.]|nr:hypothetical protein [Mucilaginibacter sp.]
MSSVKFNPVSIPGTITSIPLVVELFDNPDFRGKSIVIAQDSSNFPVDFGPDIDNMVQSVKVMPGPNWTENCVAQLFTDINLGDGRHINLPVGMYPNIWTSHLFANMTSSVKINPPYKSSVVLPPNPYAQKE